MIVSHKHQFIFVHIHKTAGEAFSAALAPHLGESDFQIGLDHSKDNDVLNGVTLHKHSTADLIRQAVGDEVWRRYHTFATVRHPADRAMSLYNYISRKFDEQQRVSWKRRLKQTLRLVPNPMTWNAMQAFVETRDFSRFIRHPKFLADDGAQVQIHSLTDSAGDMIVDQICRFESLADDFTEVAARFGLANAALEKVNQSGDGAQKRDSLNTADREYLAGVYADDFSAFGYSA